MGLSKLTSQGDNYDTIAKKKRKKKQTGSHNSTKKICHYF